MKHCGLRDLKRPQPGMRPEPLEEVSEPQAGIWRHMGVGYELVVNPVVPQISEQLVKFFSLPVEYISPAPSMFFLAPVVESLAVSSPVPVVENYCTKASKKLIASAYFGASCTSASNIKSSCKNC